MSKCYELEEESLQHRSTVVYESLASRLEATMPEASMQEATMRQATVSKAIMPEASMPEATMPEGFSHSVNRSSGAKDSLGVITGYDNSTLLNWENLNMTKIGTIGSMNAESRNSVVLGKFAGICDIVRFQSS